MTSDREKNIANEGVFKMLDRTISAIGAPIGELRETDNPFDFGGECTVKSRSLNGGVQHLYKFPNGFGASVIRHAGSYGTEQGLFELAVLDSNGKLTYDTPITDDVIGNLLPDEVADLLVQIAGLS